MDTGASPPVCCKFPMYGTNESRIIIDQIGNILKNDCIEDCKGSWGMQIVLVGKPHQDHVENIEYVFWCMCVSYRGLNKFTRPFEYPMPRCDDAI